MCLLLSKSQVYVQKAICIFTRFHVSFLLKKVIFLLGQLRKEDWPFGLPRGKRTRNIITADTQTSTSYLHWEIHLWSPSRPIDIIPINRRWKHLIVLLHKKSLQSSTTN